MHFFEQTFLRIFHQLENNNINNSDDDDNNEAPTLTLTPYGLEPELGLEPLVRIFNSASRCSMRAISSFLSKIVISSSSAGAGAEDAGEMLAEEDAEVVVEVEVEVVVVDAAAADDDDGGEFFNGAEVAEVELGESAMDKPILRDILSLS
jgi:hypothetical protein